MSYVNADTYCRFNLVLGRILRDPYKYKCTAFHVDVYICWVAFSIDRIILVLRYAVDQRVPGAGRRQPDGCSRCL